ncbi:thermonuclease family protein [Hymenobacter sp. UYP22]|uniref:thermonuclease family protein n=1 Tax=Hymenobacter sp. UYP22 TaxID=3156348 RepID=UPI0033925AD9
MQVFRALLLAILLTGNVSVRAQVRASRLPRLLRPAPAAGGLPASPVWQLVRVERVIDADTYEVATAGGRARVRLLGADAPEADQPFGPEATALVKALLRRQYVWLQVRGRDLYGRHLAAVRLRPAAFSFAGLVALDSLLVVRGWAWAYEPDRATARRLAEQQLAQRTGRGLWQCPQPMEPRLWRGLDNETKRRNRGGCPRLQQAR